MVKNHDIHYIKFEHNEDTILRQNFNLYNSLNPPLISINNNLTPKQMTSLNRISYITEKFHAYQILYLLYRRTVEAFKIYANNLMKFSDYVIISPKLQLLCFEINSNVTNPGFAAFLPTYRNMFPSYTESRSGFLFVFVSCLTSDKWC